MDRADDFPNDPRALALSERAAWLQRMQGAQRHWLGRLRALCEAAPGDDFPAFLLATPPFARLSQRIGAAPSRADLSTGIKDELDHFVDAFRDYLRTVEGEEVFVGKRAG